MRGGGAGDECEDQPLLLVGKRTYVLLELQM